MTAKQLLARFSKGSPFGVLLTDMASDNSERRLKAYEKVHKLDPFESWKDARTPSWFVSEKDALLMLEAGREIDFPLPKNDWQDGFDHALTKLWRSPYPSLAKAVGETYPKTHESRRCTLLTLLGVIGTREAAETFVTCLREHGRPDGVYGRFAEEVENLFAHPDVMLPEVLSIAGPLKKPVMEAIVNALGNGKLNPAKAGTRLESLVPELLPPLKKSFQSAAKYQSKPGTKWRFSSQYANTRYTLGVLLDIAGYVKAKDVLPMLREASKFNDPRLAMFAALSLLRRKEKVPAAVLEKIAASHETRADLFHGLSRLKLESKFPKKWRTWEAFAASRMTEWLAYPAELGREPDTLELAHQEVLDKRRKIVMCIWKFTDGKKSLAGVSGPHEFRGTPRPVHGSYTFSCFDVWDSAEPLEHLERCAGTAENILSSGKKAK